MRLILSSLLIVSCGQSLPFYDNHYQNVTNYNISATLRTPVNGVKVDNSNISIDLNYLDQLISQTENCLRQTYPSGELDIDTISQNHCLWRSFRINNDYITVKIAPNYHIGCSGEEQFPCSVNPQLCINKGLQPTPECPCECRGAVQDDSIAITTPDFYLLKSDLVRILTSCNFPFVGILASCI